MASNNVTTFYVGGKAMEVMWKSGVTEYRYYLGDFAIVSKQVSTGSTTTQTRYLHHDHLGSIDAVSNSDGTVAERQSFDAWGKRRQANWVPQGSISGFQSFSPYVLQGFTGHEMIDPVGLIHMNGRVYDPEIGRFLSADPTIQDISNFQDWNRYSYVLNNPLSLTDPTGFFFSGIFKAIGSIFSEIINAIGSVFKAILNVPVLRAAIQVVACGFGGPAGIAACIGATGAIALAAGGSLADAAKAMAFSAASFGVWSGVGELLHGIEATGLSVANALVTPLVHGAVGGAMSLAQGGSFVEGFASGALGQLGGIVTMSSDLGNIAGFAGKAIRSSVSGILGGTASIIAGGKFANGFVTSAFAHLWNSEQMDMMKESVELWQAEQEALGHKIYGTELTFDAIDKSGNSVYYRGKPLSGRLDGLGQSVIGYLESTELKNGKFAKFSPRQKFLLPYIDDGLIRFRGPRAAAAGIDGLTMREVAIKFELPGYQGLRFYNAPTFSPRAQIQWLRFIRGQRR